MLFYLYEYCYSLLAVMVTNVGEILQMEIFQITLKLPPLWPMLFVVMESCSYFVFKSFCFSMFSVYLNWIDKGTQTDTLLEYLQEFSIFPVWCLMSDHLDEIFITWWEWRQSVVSSLNLRKWSHKMCFSQSSPGPHSPQSVQQPWGWSGLMWNYK